MRERVRRRKGGEEGRMTKKNRIQGNQNEGGEGG
jgi:hypothetical protein